MSDEDDYMSEDILNACAKNDVRPGLLFRQADKRSNSLHKRKVEKDVESRQPKKGRLEAERRQIGLEQPLGQDNKGFALLQKMGFAPGGTIGKPGGSSGLREPVTVVVKTDRAGLGRESALKEVRQRKEAIRASKAKSPIDLNQYRSQLSSKFSSRAVGKDLRVSQLACQDLDSKNNIDSPAYPWFWIPQCKKNEKQDDDEAEEDDKADEDGEDQDKESEEEEEVEEKLEPEEQLEILTLYLRKSYFYCIWCGIEYKDEDDLQEDCPGSTKSDH